MCVSIHHKELPCIAEKIVQLCNLNSLEMFHQMLYRVKNKKGRLLYVAKEPKPAFLNLLVFATQFPITIFIAPP